MLASPLTAGVQQAFVDVVLPTSQAVKGRCSFCRVRRKGPLVAPTRPTQRRLFRACVPGPSRLPPDDLASPDDVFLSAEARTMAWARGIVVELNLCPFARGALERSRVRTVVTPVEDEVSLQAVVEREANLLATTSRDDIETTLVVAVSFASDDFFRFHAFATELENSLEEDEYFGEKVMVACFHPEHQWADAEEFHSAVNFDKRAPYPVVNLLRYDQVNEYVEEGLTQDILDRNIRTLTDLGSEKLLKMYRNLGS